MHVFANPVTYIQYTILPEYLTNALYEAWNATMLVLWSL